MASSINRELNSGQNQSRTPLKRHSVEARVSGFGVAEPRSGSRGLGYVLLSIKWVFKLIQVSVSPLPNLVIFSKTFQQNDVACHY